MTNSPSKKAFQVGGVKVRVRDQPNLRGATLSYLPTGSQIEAEPASRTEADGYVWWQHAAGWSAERSLDGGEIYLLLVADQDIPDEQPEPSPPLTQPTRAGDADERPKLLQKKQFQIGGVPVRVRSQPSLSGESLGYLDPGGQIEADPASRTEADGYVWWQHAAGWSAERSLDGGEIYLLLVADQDIPDEQPEPSPPLTQPTRAGDADERPKLLQKKQFQIGGVPVRVRSQPSLSGESLGYLDPGGQIEADPASRTEADGYVWWQHPTGWSAERSPNGKEIYLFEPGQVPAAPARGAPVISLPDTVEGLPDDEALPLRGQLFKRLPVDLAQVQWWQYYGNNVFGHDNWSNGVKWYEYSQSLHGGLDWGNSSTPGVPIYAGVEGVFDKHITTSFRPNGLFVTVGDYTIIYGHLANPRPLQPGQPVGPDTVMGEIDTGGQAHLHLEVRYKQKWIVNPLLLMPEDMLGAILAKFPPSPKYFYRDAGWTRWQTPLNQPVLTLYGPVIGPHGG